MSERWFIAKHTGPRGNGYWLALIGTALVAASFLVNRIVDGERYWALPPVFSFLAAVALNLLHGTRYPGWHLGLLRFFAGTFSFGFFVNWCREVSCFAFSSGDWEHTLYIVWTPIFLTFFILNVGWSKAHAIAIARIVYASGIVLLLIALGRSSFIWRDLGKWSPLLPLVIPFTVTIIGAAAMTIGGYRLLKQAQSIHVLPIIATPLSCDRPVRMHFGGSTSHKLAVAGAALMTACLAGWNVAERWNPLLIPMLALATLSLLSLLGSQHSRWQIFSMRLIAAALLVCSSIFLVAAPVFAAA
jgi:hypothetical protein